MITSRRPVNNPSYRQRTIYHGMLVGGVAFIAGALLVIAHEGTKDIIAQRYAEDMLAMLNEVIPSSHYDNDLLNDQLTIEGKNVFQARIGNKVTAVAYQVSEPGYSGVITLIMGMNNKGEILGVRVVSHSETPGLGDKMETARSPWIHRFAGQKLTDKNQTQWAVKKDGGTFDQFTGATITPRAIVKAVKNGLHFFRQYKIQLLEFEAAPTQTQEQAQGAETS